MATLTTASELLLHDANQLGLGGYSNLKEYGIAIIGE